MTLEDTHLMEVVERSPAAAGRRDRHGWVALFTADGSVEDPVGSQPHVGHTALGRFFDTFIAPRSVVFHRDLDIVCGDTVIRDLTLGIEMGAGVTMAVPAVLRYRLRAVDEELKIASLRAYWELPPMLMQFLGHGVSALPAGLTLTRTLLANQGLGGALGFLRGLRRPGPHQREALVEALTALSVGDELAVRRSLGTAEVAVDLDELRTQFYGASWEKVIAAGRSVTATVHTVDRRMVVIAEFAARAAIERLEVFG